MNTNKDTPLFNGWLENLKASLEKRGAKSQLARHLAESNDSGFEARKAQISRILNGTMPTAETLLLINQWLDSNAG